VQGERAVHPGRRAADEAGKPALVDGLRVFRRVEQLLALRLLDNAWPTLRPLLINQTRGQPTR
jgi:hypothetical protein